MFFDQIIERAMQDDLDRESSRLKALDEARARRRASELREGRMDATALLAELNGGVVPDTMPSFTTPTQIGNGSSHAARPTNAFAPPPGLGGK